MLRCSARLIAFFAFPLVASACATTGSTVGSGVGDTYLERPPYYAGAPAGTVAAAGAPIGHLPIGYQRGATQPPLFDPDGGGGTPVGTLLREMNAYLDSLAAATGGSVRIAVASVPSNAVAPDVRFGCRTATGAPGEDCEPRDSRASLGRRSQNMHLAVGRPSSSWVSWARESAAVSGAERVLVVALEVGQYLPRQSGLIGDKSIELGTDYVQPLPWLTSLETPVAVLQLTGALMDLDGRAVRIGAEGIYARRTRLLLSAIGAQELITGEDVEAVRSLRREDRIGQPLAWQHALSTLYAQLTGKF
jgi:hypothetical protein